MRSQKIMSLVLFISFQLASPSLSLSLNKGLTILDQSFDEDTSSRGSCDLILMTHVDQDAYRGNRGHYSLSSLSLLDSKKFFSKSQSHCLTLVTSGMVDVKELIHVGPKIQLTKPLAVLLIPIPKEHNITFELLSLDLSFSVMVIPSDLKGNSN